MTTVAGRLGVNMNKETKTVLQNMMNEYDIDATEATRRAFAIYDIFDKAHDNNQTIQLVDADGTVTVMSILKD